MVVTKELEIKMYWDTTIHPVEYLRLERPMEPLYTAIDNFRGHKYFVNQPGNFFQKWKILLACDPLIQLPGIYAREMKHMFLQILVRECSKQPYL